MCMSFVEGVDFYGMCSESCREGSDETKQSTRCGQGMNEGGGVLMGFDRSSSASGFFVAEVSIIRTLVSAAKGLLSESLVADRLLPQ